MHTMHILAWLGLRLLAILALVAAVMLPAYGLNMPMNRVLSAGAAAFLMSVFICEYKIWRIGKRLRLAYGQEQKVYRDQRICFMSLELLSFVLALSLELQSLGWLTGLLALLVPTVAVLSVIRAYQLVKKCTSNGWGTCL